MFLVGLCVQLFIIGLMTMTVFLRTRMEIDIEDGNYFMGALFFALILLLVDGFPELVMTIQRLEVFYKQKQFYFYPAWAYAIPAAILKIPLSLVESLVWTSLTYYVIGFTPQPIRLVFMNSLVCNHSQNAIIWIQRLELLFFFLF